MQNLVEDPLYHWATLRSYWHFAVRCFHAPACSGTVQLTAWSSLLVSVLSAAESSGTGLGKSWERITSRCPGIKYSIFWHFSDQSCVTVCVWLWQVLQISHAGEAWSFGHGYQLWPFQWYHDWCRICQHSLPDSQHQTGRSPMGSASVFNVGVPAHWLKQVVIYVFAGNGFDLHVCF